MAPAHMAMGDLPLWPTIRDRDGPGACGFFIHTGSGLPVAEGLALLTKSRKLVSPFCQAPPTGGDPEAPSPGMGGAERDPFLLKAEEGKLRPPLPSKKSLSLI